MSNLESLIPSMGMRLDNIGNNYQLFLNSSSKKDRVQQLWDIRLAAIDVHNTAKRILEVLTGILVIPEPDVSLLLDGAVQRVTANGNIHFQILNLDHLVRCFLKEPDNQQQIQYLYQIYKLTADIAEVALTTNAEPEKGAEI